MRVDVGEGDEADAVEFLLQVQGDDAGGADAEDIAAARADDVIDGGGERIEVQRAGRVLDRAGVGVGDLFHDRQQCVVGGDVRRALELIGRAAARTKFQREPEPQLGIALDTDLAAKPHDRRFGDVGRVGEHGDRHRGGLARMIDDELADAGHGRLQFGQVAADPRGEGELRVAKGAR